MTKTDIYGTQNTVVRVATLRTKNGILDVAFSIDIPNPPNLLASEKPEVSAQDGSKVQNDHSTSGAATEVSSWNGLDHGESESSDDISDDELVKGNVRAWLEEKERESPVEEYKVMTTLGQLFSARFNHFGNIVDINKAIHYASQAASLIPEDHADMPALLSGLGASHRYRFESLGELADIQQAISCQTRATILVPTGHIDQPSWLCNLGTSYWSRSRRFGEIEDINAALKYHSRAVEIAPDSHSDKHTMLNSLGAAYQSRFERLGNAQDINDAIDCKSKAISLTPEDHPSLPAWLSNLGNSYLFRHAHLGEPSDIETAILHQRQAVSLTLSDHQDMPVRLCNLGMSYLRRFENSGELADIDNAINCIGAALSYGSSDHPHIPIWLAHLGDSYQRRFERTGELKDINEAINLSSQAVSLAEADHESASTYIANLGNSYMSRFEHLGKIEDVEEAIECYNRAVSLTPGGHPNKPNRLSGLGSSYRNRFEHLGNLQDIENAIDCQRIAIMLAPDSHHMKPGWLSSLGSYFNSRFERLGQHADIEKAISYHSQAVSMAPDDHVEKPDWLGSLGVSYQSRFEHQGNITDIDKSIECMQQAVSIAPDDYTHKPAWLSNLGNSYQSRFQWLGDIADIDKSIDTKRQALALATDGHSIIPTLLINLGLSYQVRYQSLGEHDDETGAIFYTTEAVALLPDEHEHKRAALQNLGISYQSRFERTGELSDNSAAMNLLNQALALTPDDHADRPDWLSNLGKVYQSRFEHQGDLTDIDEAISYHEQAISLTPNGYAKAPMWLGELADWYLSRFDRLRRPQDIERAIKYFQQAAGSNVGQPYPRFMASRKWAELSVSHSISSPLLAYQRTMELVPQVVWLGATINQRFDGLAIMGNISMEAASCAISLGAYDRALEWLEDGRSVVWNQILRLRMSFEGLSTANPLLAKRLTQVGQELERAGSRITITFPQTNNVPNLEKEAQDHRRLAAEWDELIEKTRKISGFEDFMRSSQVDTLMRAAKDGPVVVINMHQSRCDALVIQPGHGEIAHVPLGNFSLDKAIDARVQLKAYIGHRGGRARGFKRSKPAQTPEESFKGMLTTLWWDVVKPVLSFLGYTSRTSAQELPHVTWCTTGALSFLPLHAAGCYDGPGPKATDFVVSSYTPTLSALLQSSSMSCASSSGVLAIGQRHTKGLSELPNTVQELAMVKELSKGTRYLQLDGANATVDAVLEAMDEYSWVHFACHASQNPADPAQSAFHLHDGNLLLSAITRRSFKGKGIAFLSACQTATGDERLPDESVHLAAGMLMAGYRSVVATMWGINDVDAPEVARQVYADLLRDGGVNCTGASRALHKAVAALREQVGESSFERWVPFIHIGS